MRKVLFKRWIPQEYLKSENGSKQLVEGTGCWQKEYVNYGLFHQWANKYDEFESGAGNYTVAIVELEDGTIEEVLPLALKFDDKLSSAYR